jgi:hypothetical protein
VIITQAGTLRNRRCIYGNRAEAVGGAGLPGKWLLIEQRGLRLAPPASQYRVMADGSSTSPTGLTRAIAVLTVLGSAESTGADGLGIVQIARLAGREKTQVPRALKTPAKAGLVTREVKAAAGYLSHALVAGPGPGEAAPAVTGKSGGPGEPGRAGD